MRELTLPYEPRSQFLPFHERSDRFASLVCHRRMGKTVACVNDLIAKALHTRKKDARYAYIAPYYGQAKDVAWDYLKEGCSPLSPTISESGLRVILPNKARIALYGADNPRSLHGIYLDGVVVDEFGDCKPSLWGETLLPTLIDRKGWAVFIGTAQGKNHFYEVHERSKVTAGWYSMTGKASETGIIPEEELAILRAQMHPHKYAREMECSFDAPVEGTYYAWLIAEMEADGRISPSGPLYDPALPVFVAADIGRTDSTAFWFWQEVVEDGAKCVRVIDYEERAGWIVEQLVELLAGKGYAYDTVWLPHDAKAHTVVTQRSTVEQVRDAGFLCRCVPKLSKQHGIDAARKMLPQMRINQAKCYRGIEALRAYRRRYDGDKDEYGDVPVHDWASDGADGFRYMSLVCAQGSVKPPSDKVKEEPWLEGPRYTLDKLFEEHASNWRRRILRL